MGASRVEMDDFAPSPAPPCRPSKHMALGRGREDHVTDIVQWRWADGAGRGGAGRGGAGRGGAGRGGAGRGGAGRGAGGCRGAARRLRPTLGERLPGRPLPPAHPVPAGLAFNESLPSAAPSPRRREGAFAHRAQHPWRFSGTPMSPQCHPIDRCTPN
jgi:hypothetical protein